MYFKETHQVNKPLSILSVKYPFTILNNLTIPLKEVKYFELCNVCLSTRCLFRYCSIHSPIKNNLNKHNLNFKPF